MRSKDSVVLLVEGTARLRPVLTARRVNVVIERPRSLEGLFLPERIWRWHGERDTLSGVRIFREDLPPPPPEPAECPVYDELVIKEPLPLLPPRER